MKYCTHCGCEVVDDATVCPKCGSELSVPSTYKKSKSSYSFDGGTNGFAIAGFVCSFFIPLLGWIFGGIGLNRANSTYGKGKGYRLQQLSLLQLCLSLTWSLSLQDNIKLSNKK